MPESLEADATVPMHYVISIDNSKFSTMNNYSNLLGSSCI